MIGKIYLWLNQQLAKKDERGLPSAGVWSSKIREYALSLCQGKQGLLLDIGCGEGLFLRRLAKGKITAFGIDINIKQLEIARKNPGESCCLSAASAFSLPFKPETFDTLVCINTFYNMKSLAEVREIIRQMRFVGKKESRIIFDFRNSVNPALKLKYKLAPVYDETIRKSKLPLSVFSLKEMETVLSEENFALISKKFLGFPYNMFSPVVIIEAKKC